MILRRNPWDKIMFQFIFGSMIPECLFGHQDVGPIFVDLPRGLKSLMLALISHELSVYLFFFFETDPTNTPKNHASCHIVGNYVDI